MATRLAFRGPDGTHIKTLPGAGFCFTFLRTGPAPQCPSQPCTLDGRVWLLGDVRLDGRDDVRRKLEQSGEELGAEATDEELVLRTWRLWGEEGIAELIGDYAFALWDSEARQLRCWRDLMGARPFFYAQAGGWFYFSNTLNAIRCAPGISRDLDHHFIGDFLLQGSSSYTECTAFRDISRVPAGHRMRLSAGCVEVRRYASFPVEEPLRLKNESDYVAKFRELLEQAVRERLPLNTAAIYMSGGLDSTSVAAITKHISAKHARSIEIRAYTVDYQPLFDDQEGRLASLAARHIGISSEIALGFSCLPFANWGEGLRWMPEPYHEPFHYLHLSQSRRIAEHTRVVFNGYGGDGALTGQSWPYLMNLIRNRGFAEIIKTFGIYLLKHRRIPPLRRGFRSSFRQWINREDPMASYPKWLAPQFERENHLRARWHELRRPIEGVHPWHPRAHALLQSPLWTSLLESDGPEWSGLPLESRAPLLDFRIQRFLLQIPPVPLCVNKELLRRAVADCLPREILSRPKIASGYDQIALQISKELWSPSRLLPISESVLQTFVDTAKVDSALKTESCFYPWVNLRPVSFAYWAQEVERERHIQ
jgi:asparagine synthase (glutamine-hydrolysing)